MGRLMFATLLFSLSVPASQIPARFESTANAVGGVVAVTAEQIDGLTDLKSEFLRLQNEKSEAPEGFEPSMAIYAIRATGGQKVFVGEGTSVGIESVERILKSLETALGNYTCENDPFKQHHSWLVSALAGTTTMNLPAVASNLSNLIHALSEESDVQIDRSYYARGCNLDSFSGTIDQAFFVDPTPSSSPDEFVHLVVHRKAWSE